MAVSSSSSSSAVLLQNAFKSYGKKEVLKNLCMNVRKGTIYGLLGASGCGKTTLLSCIVGMKQLNAGDVWVLGGKPGAEGSGVPGPRVGFMPQEIALVGEFTVKDAVYYFGRIFNMPDDLIEERFRNLSELLNLPPDNRFIKNCSGGQQRRVSFAAAMVHKPDLLILDEPTVGVDPVLRERIWDYLIEVTNEGTMSVIITTHYIEEARRAHTIGLMRDGRLLAEETPNNLLNMFQTDSLEEVFLILSRRQEEGRLAAIAPERSEVMGTNNSNSNTNVSVASFEISYGSTDVLTTKPKKRKYPKHSAISLNKHRLKALLDKNWKQFYRNPSGIVYLMMFPILECLAFFFSIGQDVRSIPLAIVNDETMSPLCQNFTLNGTAIPYSFSSCNFSELSCRFLEYLEDPMIYKVKYDLLPEALEDIKHGKVVGVLFIAENFTDSFEKRSEDGRKIDEYELDTSEIKVWLDMSNRQIGEEIKYKLLRRYMDFQKELFADCNYYPKLTEFMELETIHGDKDEKFTIFVVPGMVLTIMFFMGVTTTSQIIISDRCEGVWDRSTVAGVSSLEITLTHLVIQSCIIVAHTIEVFIITFLIFRVEYAGYMWILILLAFLQGIVGMTFGFWISIISSSQSMANVISTGCFYPMIILCGLIWPLEGMPVFLQWISKCLPFTNAIISFRNVMNKGWNFTNFYVLNGLGTEVIWIAFLIVINVYLIKLKR